MFNEPLLDPSQRIKNDAIQEVTASILDDAIFYSGETGNMEIKVSIGRTIINFSTRLQIYDADGRCAFVGKLEQNGRLIPGNYALNIFFLANFQPGKYAASFEFSESTLAEPYEKFNSEILWLHNLFLEFSVISQITRSDSAELRSTDTESFLCYADIPYSMSIYPESRSDKIAPHPRSPSTSVFPFPLKGAQFSLPEIESAIERAFGRRAGIHSNDTTQAPLTPTSLGRTFPATLPPMHTAVGVGAFHENQIQSIGTAGYLLFGPYISILPGQYTVVFKGKTERLTKGQIILDVSAKQGVIVLTKTILKLEPNQIIDASLQITVQSPGFVDLEFRVYVGKDVEISMESISITPVFDASSPTTKKIESLLRNISYDEITLSSNEVVRIKKSKEKSKDCALIFISSQIYTLCGLAVAYHLHQKFGYKVILVSAQAFNEAITPSIEKLCGIERSILLEHLNIESLTSTVDLIVAHRSDQFKPIIGKFPKKHGEIAFQIYSDGFRNAVDINGLKLLPRISKIYFFGIDYFHSELFDDFETEVIELAVTNKLISRCAQAYLLNGYEDKNAYSPYSVFCVRYWGLNYYNFPPQVVADIWYETIALHTPKKELIILKGGGASVLDAQSCKLFKEQLVNNGYKFIDADDYLISCGLTKANARIPLEYLLYFGFFRQATRFYTLDSSLPVILSHLDFVMRPVEIICGAKDLTKLSGSGGFQSLNSHMLQLHNSFEKVVEFKPFEVTKIDAHHFVIKLQ